MEEEVFKCLPLCETSRWRLHVTQLAVPMTSPLRARPFVDYRPSLAALPRKKEKNKKKRLHAPRTSMTVFQVAVLRIHGERLTASRSTCLLSSRLRPARARRSRGEEGRWWRESGGGDVGVGGWMDGEGWGRKGKEEAFCVAGC